MKIVKLQGGLGNQMFQYAFGQALGEGVVYDNSWFKKIKKSKNVTVRDYELDNFLCRPCFYPRYKISFLKRISSFLKKMGFKNTFSFITEEPQNIYNPALLEIKNAYISGFFQCADYMDKVREQMLREFMPRQPLNKQNQEMLDKITSVNAISLHIRRGDYVRLNIDISKNGLAYYERAVQYVADRVQNPHFFIFSDDMAWVKENLNIPYPVTFVDINRGKNSFLDIFLMRNCRHNIIANSSFSWWGGYLNENIDKIVIAPKGWIDPNVQTDILPKTWIQL